MSLENSNVAIEKSVAQDLGVVSSFAAGSLAACAAVTFTNPIELVKTRMQLQGELTKAANVEKIYKNPFQALVVIGRNEGIRGLQNGLGCAYVYQVLLNGSRLGFYEPIRNSMNSFFFPHFEAYKVQNTAINVAAGTAAGVIGAILGSPLYLVKTRMQSFSDKIKIGDQSKYNNAVDGLRQIYAKEGFKGWFRGLDSAILRTGIASAVQLPIYNSSKHFLLSHKYFEGESLSLHLTASTVSGMGVSIVMNPWDVVLTRVYNQTGNLYKGPIDCMYKIIKYEGITALYKGFGAQAMRMAPHTILCLTFMEQTMKLIKYAENKIFI
ncbi:hypothetical protein PACTADRAFT_49822 [Pachysolen tannophilus NRRL Y-2460]|uniref:Mitochondrial oxaloacetate transport protein n=1 Tax=Pachysolen tannophilus NRRL Y-2460 TaxID=669874 RepID=A0A1E4TXN1_PACTA|nr:hypothetical protein PACTADRAFT_49822 [Pachysolen tannophilus NRRL Y-2460]